MIPIQSHTLSIDGLAKRFGRLPVLKGLDLQFERGSATAIIGHNGSGKTTLIKIILGLVRPDAGRLFFDGAKLNGQADYRARIGYMPQAARFPENLTANELFSMLKDLRGNPGDIDKELIHDKQLIHDKELIHDEELIHAFRLAPELNKPLRTLSGGTRQKVSAVIAFLFRPAFIILDEPTAGLDPVASSILKDKIRQERARGTTFILTSHIMSEIEEVADRIVFLLDGRIQFTGTAADIKHATGQPHLERAIAHLMTEAAA